MHTFCTSIEPFSALPMQLMTGNVMVIGVACSLDLRPGWVSRVSLQYYMYTDHRFATLNFLTNISDYIYDHIQRQHACSSDLTLDYGG
jgi:hypothetical protein